MSSDRVTQLIEEFIREGEVREKLDPKMEVIRAYLSTKLGINEDLINGYHVVKFVKEAPESLLKDMLRKTRNIGPKTLEKIRLTGHGTDQSRPMQKLIRIRSR